MAYKQPRKLNLSKSPYQSRNDKESRTIFQAVDFKKLAISKDEETEQGTFEEYFEMQTGNKTFTVLPPLVDPSKIIRSDVYFRAFMVKHDGYIREINNNGDFEKYSATWLPNTYFKVILKWFNTVASPFEIESKNKREVERGAQQLPRGGGLREKFILYFSDLFNLKTITSIASHFI